VTLILERASASRASGEWNDDDYDVLALRPSRAPHADNSISPKPATKRFLIFRIELLILVDDLSTHRTSPQGKMEEGYQVPAKPYVKQFTQFDAR